MNKIEIEYTIEINEKTKTIKEIKTMHFSDVINNETNNIKTIDFIKGDFKTISKALKELYKTGNTKALKIINNNKKQVEVASKIRKKN